ncbi:MAG: aminomethyltransferase family protein [Actinomycetota bacterium]
MSPARKHTPYHQKFVELGAEIGDRIGFDAAVVFTSVEEEHLATRNAVGIYDVYYQGPIDIKGPDAEKLLDRILVRDVPRRLIDGRVLYSSVCNEAGGMIDDLTAYRLSSEHFWLIPTPSRVEAIEAHLRAEAQSLRAYVTNCVSGTAYLSVQGPRSRELLAGLAPDADLSTAALPYYNFIETTVAEAPTLLSRTGYSGELGYELYYPRDYASHMWEAVHAAGAGLAAKPAGLGALRSTRMEKKYPLYLLDVSEETTPLEAALGWAVDIDGADFIGRDALAKQRDDGVTRILAGIEFPDTTFLPAAGDLISADGREVGKVTSSDTGWFLGKNLAMGYVDAGTPQGSEVTVVSAETGESAAGVLSDRAFYDPDRERVRA